MVIHEMTIHCAPTDPAPWNVQGKAAEFEVKGALLPATSVSTH